MIIISRDSEGNPTSVQIDTGNCFALVPIATFSPLTLDWESITYEPTRNAIKAAWDAWVAEESPDLNHESPTYVFRPRPDLAPQVPVIPNWKAFSDSLSISLLLKVNALALGAMLVSRITRLADGAVQWEGVNDRLLQLWNAQPPSLSAEERTALNDLAAQHDIPLTVDSNNQILAE